MIYRIDLDLAFRKLQAVSFQNNYEGFTQMAVLLEGNRAPSDLYIELQQTDGTSVDFTHIVPTTIPLVTQRFREAMDQTVSSEVQYIETNLLIADNLTYVMNVLTSVPFTASPNPEALVSPDFKLNASEIAGLKFFRMRGASLFCDDDVKQVIEGHKLSGIRFVEVIVD